VATATVRTSADERRGVVRAGDDEPDLRDHAEREEQPDAHLAAADEVRDPQREE